MTAAIGLLGPSVPSDSNIQPTTEGGGGGHAAAEEGEGRVTGRGSEGDQWCGSGGITSGVER